MSAKVEFYPWTNRLMIAIKTKLNCAGNDLIIICVLFVANQVILPKEIKKEFQEWTTYCGRGARTNKHPRQAD